jgi:MSHA biogenesis protein MshG
MKKSFLYDGRDVNRNQVSGTLLALDPNAAIAHLKQNGITVLSLTEEKSSFLKDIFHQLNKKKISPQEILLFTRQLHSMTKSGVPVLQGLQSIEKGLQDKYFQNIVNDIIDQLSSGTALAKALKKHSNVFSVVYINIVKAGEASGQLEIGFSFLVKHLAFDISTKKKLKAAVRYPIFVTTSIFIVFSLVNFFVIPKFKVIFDRFHMPLPLPTRIILGTSNFMMSHWVWMTGIIISGVFAFNHLNKTLKWKSYFDRIKLRIPIFGKVLKYLLYARFTSTFSMLVSTGVPIVDSIRLVSNTTGNQHVADKMSCVSSSVQQGALVSKSFENSKLFSPLVIQMILVGEKTGNLEEMMEQVSDYYESEADFILDRLSSLIEPILIVFLGFIVLLLALGVFLPMWNLSDIIKHKN